MNHRTHRLRRLAAAAALGVGMLGSVVGFAAGTAGAVGATSHNNAITATSAPVVPSTGSNNAAGNLKITLHNETGKKVKTSNLDLYVTPGGSGRVGWASAPTVNGASITATQLYGALVTELKLKVTMTAGTTRSVTITGIKYDTTAAHGTVFVYPTGWTKTTTATVTATVPGTIGDFTSGTSAVNAIATAPTPAPAATQTLTATATPTVKPTGSGQTAGTWTIKFTGAKGHGWTKDTTFSISVHEPTGSNCTSTAGKGFILVTGTPSGKIGSSKSVSTAPTFVVSTSATGTQCKAISHNDVTVTFTNTGTFTATTPATNSFTIALSGVKYNIHQGSSQVYGNVEVGYTKTTGNSVAASGTGHPAGPSNAAIAAVVMTANTPPKTYTPASYDAAISPVSVIEQVAGSIPSGDYVCLTLVQTAATDHFNAANSATAAAKSGNGVVTSTVHYFTGGVAKTSGNASTAVFKVKTASTATHASTYTVSGLAVDASDTSGPVLVVGVYSTTSHCTTGQTGTSAGTAVAFTLSVPKFTRVAGATAAGTAAAQLLYEFTATGTTPGDCPGTTTTATTAGVAKRAVVLANETHFPDALSSQYLAGRLHTGTLLTGATSLPSATLNALRLEGISHVYVIGGPLAVSTTVVNQLETTPSYNCGGSGVRKTGAGATRYLTVTRIGGATQYDTAEMVATYLAKSSVGTAEFPAAFAGVNKTGGNGEFNDTSGNASPAGLGVRQRTGILASGQVFQDAMASGPFAYGDGFPVLLTTPSKLSSQASSAFSALTITQVIVMGGPLAVSNTVVTSLEAAGIHVLRIAGADYTDTAVQAANFEVAPGTTTGLGWRPSNHGHTIAVARGNGFSDGLAGAVITGNNGWPLLLTENPTAVGSYLTAWLKHAGLAGPGVDQATGATTANYREYSAVIFGGTLAITPAVVKTIQTDLTTG